MIDTASLLAVDERFFDALVANDIPAIEMLLADDFMIVDVGSGTPFPKNAFIDAMRDGALVFSAVERNPEEANVRTYGDTGIIINQTVLRGTFAGTPFETRSRYTHVFVRNDADWRMVSAQGTPIAES